MADMALDFKSSLANRAPAVGIVLILLSAGLCALNLAGILPVSLWGAAFTAGADASLQELMARDVLLPRFAAGLLSGAGLALAGVLFQQVLRNPLAEPGTLAVFAGAKCALVIATLWFPGLLVLGWDVIALIGGTAVVAIVLALSARHDFSPISVILAGLIVSLALGAFGSMLMMTHFDAVNDLYLWEAGSLVQNNWSVASALLVRLAIALALAALAARSLGLLDLESEAARNLGLPLAATRLIGIGIAVMISATIAGLVGLISFIGLAGPAIARTLGARRFGDRLVAGPLIGAGLLAFTDQAVLLALPGAEIPAGAVAALIGAPLLLWLLREMRPGRAGLKEAGLAPVPSLAFSSTRRLVALVLLLGCVFALALMLGRVPGGWHLALAQDFDDLLPWRLPRVAVAAAAGTMLAQAGLFLQRITGNGLASPELLGISSGAGLLLIVAQFLMPGLDRLQMIGLATAGAFAMLMLILFLGRRGGFAGEQLLLTGVALGALMASALTYFTLLGDPRILPVLSWLSGSTYAVTGTEAMAMVLIALLSLVLLPLAARLLTILPLGAAIARELGLAQGRGRLVLLLATALLTGAATLIAGPLSFVGLMAPHLARLLGFRTPVMQAYAAALTGAMLMVGADWIGRMIAFPWQVPAGFVATVIGALFYMTLLARR